MQIVIIAEVIGDFTVNAKSKAKNGCN